MFQTIRDTISILWFSAVAFAICAGIGFGIYYLQPAWLGLERQAFVASHQYIEGKRAMLLKLASEYDDNAVEAERLRAADPVKYKDTLRGMRNQQDSLLARIRGEASLLRYNEVPEPVRRLLSSNPR